MSDAFKDFDDTILAPSRAPYAVTPNDVTALPIVPKALYVGTGGTIVLCGETASADVTFVNVANGQVLDVRAAYVRATGTTASNIVALA